MRVAILLCCVVLSVHAFIQPKVDPVQYESEWAIHVNDGVDPRTLEENGYEIVGQVGNLENIYVVRHMDTHARHQSERSLKFVPSHDVTRSLMEHPDVKWAEQQFITKYNKRAITDPLFNDQWHLINTGQFSGVAGVDANVQGAWNLGFTGAGVRVAIVDDGYQTTHPDLAARYKSDSSYSFNAPTGNPPDPNVAADFHGTAASGVAMAANNSACGVGAAYMAEGAGIRLIAAGISDATSASGLTYRYQLNDIYSNSWGPGDDAISVAGPGSLTIAAIKDGTVTGRGGLGNVYVWAAGNGLLNNDNCNYDGYATMRQTIAVGAIGNNGKQSYYSEPCAAMLVTAPSNSANANAGIRTTDLLGTNGYSTTDCTTTFGGTSSACPLVAGVTALILQANPLLTWRDVHFILAKTASKNDPTDPDWATNAAGYHINHKYGFGKVDATAAVLAALNHTNLATEVIATSGTVTVGRAIPDNPATGITATTTVTTNVAIEKVLVTVRINHPTSGDLQITVISPLGTRSVMSTPHADVTVLYAGSTPYLVGTASFGANVTFAQVTGTITASAPADACTTITNCAALANKIAYVRRGTCDYTVKAKAVQLCGARGIVVVNNVAADGDAILNMGGTDATVTIPAVFLSYNDGQVVTAGQAGAITKTQYGVNSYQNGWTFATVRCLGESSAGTWSVLVEDGFPGGNGTFTSFKIDAYGSSSVPAATTAAGGAAATTAAGAAATTAAGAAAATSSASGNAAATTASAAASSTGSAAGAGTSAGAAPSSTTSKLDESSASSLSAITLFVVLASLVAMNF